MGGSPTCLSEVGLLGACLLSPRLLCHRPPLPAQATSDRVLEHRRPISKSRLFLFPPIHFLLGFLFELHRATEPGCTLVVVVLLLKTCPIAQQISSSPPSFDTPHPPCIALQPECPPLRFTLTRTTRDTREYIIQRRNRGKATTSVEHTAKMLKIWSMVGPRPDRVPSAGRSADGLNRRRSSKRLRMLPRARQRRRPRRRR